MTDPENATTASADTDQASNVKVRALFVPGAEQAHVHRLAEHVAA